MDFINQLKQKGKEFLGQHFVEDENHDVISHASVQESNSGDTNHFLDNEEGQLALDVYQTIDDVVIKAPIAGVTLQDMSITVSDGILTIRGERKNDDNIPNDNHYLQECYWGIFSRSIVLPKNLKTEEIKAYFKSGILKITIPKEEHIKIKTIPINTTIETKVTT